MKLDWFIDCAVCRAWLRPHQNRSLIHSTDSVLVWLRPQIFVWRLLQVPVLYIYIFKRTHRERNTRFKACANMPRLFQSQLRLLLRLSVQISTACAQCHKLECSESPLHSSDSRWPDHAVTTRSLIPGEDCRCEGTREERPTHALS